MARAGTPAGMHCEVAMRPVVVALAKLVILGLLAWFIASTFVFAPLDGLTVFYLVWPIAALAVSALGVVAIVFRRRGPAPLLAALAIIFGMMVAATDQLNLAKTDLYFALRRSSFESVAAQAIEGTLIKDSAGVTRRGIAYFAPAGARSLAPAGLVSIIVGPHDHFVVFRQWCGLGWQQCVTYVYRSDPESTFQDFWIECVPLSHGWYERWLRCGPIY